MKLVDPLGRPSAQQALKYPEALKRLCPVCDAKPGEACLPVGLQVPHLLRCRAGNGKDAA